MLLMSNTACCIHPWLYFIKFQLSFYKRSYNMIENEACIWKYVHYNWRNLITTHATNNWIVVNYLILFCYWFKDYLHYKTITSQIVPSETQIKNFLFRRKIMFRSQDIQVFVFLTNPWFTKLVMSRWVLAHETRCIFEYTFWTTTHDVTKLGQLIDISKDNNFQ